MTQMDTRLARDQVQYRPQIMEDGSVPCRGRGDTLTIYRVARTIGVRYDIHSLLPTSDDRARRSCCSSGGARVVMRPVTAQTPPPPCALARRALYTTHSAIKNILKGCHGLREGVFAADDDEVRRDV